MLIGSCNPVNYLQYMQNVFMKQAVFKCSLNIVFSPLCAFLVMDPSVFDVLPFFISLVSIKMPTEPQHHIYIRIFGTYIYIRLHDKMKLSLEMELKLLIG